jgi:hypothetical protein
MSMKNSSDTIGNRIRDVPVCSAVPQPTAPPRTPLKVNTILYQISSWATPASIPLKILVLYAISYYQYSNFK